MSYFGGMDQEKEQKLAWKGKATDPKVQAMRDKLEKERLAEDAAERKRLAEENRKYKAMIADEGAAEDDDIMDEEAGRMMAVNHKMSSDFYKAEKKALAAANAENKARLKNVKSKIHSYNVRGHRCSHQCHTVAAACSIHFRRSRVACSDVPAGSMDQED